MSGGRSRYSGTTPYAQPMPAPPLALFCAQVLGSESMSVYVPAGMTSLGTAIQYALLRTVVSHGP